MTVSTLILLGVIGVSFFVLIATLVRRYKRCPSDQVLVIYGRTGKNKDGGNSTAKCIHGGGAFVWPVIQDYEYLDLRPLPIEVKLTNALSKQNIRIDVPSTVTVAISSEEGIVTNAAERLLGRNRDEIELLAQEVIYGQMRLVIATMTIEEINADRDKFLEAIQLNLQNELSKIGLKLINVNVSDIRDESGYLESLGKEAAARAINDAKKSVAEKNRDGAIGVAKAEQDERVQVAQAETMAQVGEAEAMQEKEIKVSDANMRAEVGRAEALKSQRIKVADANATATEGENLAQVKIAESDADRNVAQAKAEKETTAARLTNSAKAKEEGYSAEEAAEKARAKKDKASQEADIIVPAEIAKSKMEIEAEASAEAQRRKAKGEADAILSVAEAEAKGQLAKMSAIADGLKKYVEAAGSAEGAVKLMIAEQLPELTRIQVEAIKNIKIDKITVWDNAGGGGGGEGSSTSGFLKSLFNSVPGYREIYDMVGQELPGFMQGAKEKNDAKKDTPTIEATDVTDVEDENSSPE